MAGGAPGSSPRGKRAATQRRAAAGGMLRHITFGNCPPHLPRLEASSRSTRYLCALLPTHVGAPVAHPFRHLLCGHGLGNAVARHGAHGRIARSPRLNCFLPCADIRKIPSRRWTAQPCWPWPPWVPSARQALARRLLWRARRACVRCRVGALACCGPVPVGVQNARRAVGPGPGCRNPQSYSGWHQA